MENTNRNNKNVESKMIGGQKVEIRQDNKKHLELVDKIRKEASKK